MAWGIKRRFEFIEMRLYWEGQINRKDLVNFFGISIPLASTDLRNYSEKAPNNMAYDSSAKLYATTSGFSPKYISTEPSEYFNHLLRSKKNNFDDSFLGSPLPFYTLPFPGIAVNSEVLRKIIHVFKQKKALEIKYQSMSNPDPQWRWITPHALGFDGFRWHVRSFCHKDSSFKDFTLGRIRDIGNERKHLIEPSSDLAWNNLLQLNIIPHPDLPEHQKRSVENEYGMINGVLIIDIKVAFAYYFLKRLGYDKGHETRGSKEQQTILANAKKVWNKILILNEMTVAVPTFSSERNKK